MVCQPLNLCQYCLSNNHVWTYIWFDKLMEKLLYTFHSYNVVYENTCYVCSFHTLYCWNGGHKANVLRTGAMIYKSKHDCLKKRKTVTPLVVYVLVWTSFWYILSCFVQIKHSTYKCIKCAYCYLYIFFEHQVPFLLLSVTDTRIVCIIEKIPAIISLFGSKLDFLSLSRRCRREIRLRR